MKKLTQYQREVLIGLGVIVVLFFVGVKLFHSRSVDFFYADDRLNASVNDQAVQVPQPIIEPLCIDLQKPIKENPTFMDVSHAGCEKNRYIGKEVRWKARVSGYAHTTGIRFWVIDEDHPDSDETREQHGHFWGTFLAGAQDDPRETEEGLRKWAERWSNSWVNYVMDVYGGINYEKTKADTFVVTAVVDDVTCGEEYGPDSDVGGYDGCYIETIPRKIKVF